VPVFEGVACGSESTHRPRQSGIPSPPGDVRLESGSHRQRIGRRTHHRVAVGEQQRPAREGQAAPFRRATGRPMRDRSRAPHGHRRSAQLGDMGTRPPRPLASHSPQGTRQLHPRFGRRHQGAPHPARLREAREEKAGQACARWPRGQFSRSREGGSGGSPEGGGDDGSSGGSPRNRRASHSSVTATSSLFSGDHPKTASPKTVSKSVIGLPRI